MFLAIREPGRAIPMGGEQVSWLCDVVIKKPGSSPAIGIVYRAKEFYSNKL